MSTAKAIEEITDAGDFEILATRVLRQIDSDYARVEHLGVNAEGKTVKNPLDGFCRIPGSKPSRYVMAAFSTDRADKLERKLLFDHTRSSGKKYKDSDDGDLVKAARAAVAIRQDDGDAEFILTFCTNKQPDAELMSQSYAAGKAVGIEVRFLAQSSIRDHLDTTPEGQWLRKEHLGIAADRLSLSLLQELSLKNIGDYSHELFCSAAEIVGTATTKRLAHVAIQAQPSVTVLAGPSGCGKSVACYRMLSDVLANGGIALWLPAEVTANCVSLDSAITDVLESLYPTLGPEAGRDALMLAARHKIRFVLVADDVNRTPNAVHEVQKLISWHGRIAAGESATAGPAQYSGVPFLVIPLWSHHWSSIASRYRGGGRIGEVNAQPMNSAEAVACLRACSHQPIDEQPASELVRRLELDPILIGLWSEMYRDAATVQLDAEASTLISEYIERSICEDAAGANLLPADFRGALDTLAARMLEERDLYPEWSRVADWLNATQLDALRRLAVSGRLCRVVRRDNINRFEFRHDRLLETALATPLSECLSDIDNNRDIISDPYFTDSIARALITTQCTELVGRLRNVAPLVVLRAIRHVEDTQSDFAKATVAAAADWLGEATKTTTIPFELLFVASRILEATQSPLVLVVTEPVKADQRFAGARLANGDAVHGKFFVGNTSFYPSMRAPFVEDVVTRAFKVHHERLLDDLATDLDEGCASEPELRAALILAGYSGDSRMAEPVLRAWKRDKDNRCLWEALWAETRCSTQPEITLAPVLDSWATLSDEKDQYQSSERSRFLTELTFSMRHGVNGRVIEYLANRAQVDDRLSGCITALLQQIDDPVATAFVAQKIAQVERSIEGSARFSPWVYRCRDDWDPLRWRGRRLSDSSRNAILSLWKDSNEESLKESLLRTWVATTDAVQELQSLPNGFATSRTVVWRRARLGDLSVVDTVLERLVKEPEWWDVVPAIWTDRFIEALDKALAALGEETPADFSGGLSNDHYLLARVLRDIPAAVSEELIQKHWNALKFSARVVQVALYIAAEPLVIAAAHVLKDAPDEWEPFRHIGSTFGFMTVGLKERITNGQIDVLLPYVSRLPDIELMEIAKWLLEHGRESDLRAVVSAEINQRIEAQRAEGENSYVFRVKRVEYASDTDLLNDLTEIEMSDGVVWHWCHFATERGDNPERIRGILRTWFMEKPSTGRLLIVAAIVLELGHREDVSDLQRYQSQYGDESTKAAVDGAAFAVRYRTLS